ncbi:hypothetical protein M085_3033 [Bacteroides fragilis str. 3986 N(B)19]|nr:hypothetical protein M085_3033 [Bacteroides fragilis str. 3986 N(B)19]
MSFRKPYRHKKKHPEKISGMPEYIGVRYISATRQTVHSHP